MKKKCKTLKYTNVDLKSKDKKTEAVAISANAAGDKYNIYIQVFRSTPFPDNYIKYCAVFYSSGAEDQIKFNSESLRLRIHNNTVPPSLVVSGDIDRTEFEKLKKASSIQIVLTGEGTFYEDEKDTMGKNNFSTNKLFQAALKEFFNTENLYLNNTRNNTSNNTQNSSSNDTSDNAPTDTTKTKKVAKKGKDNISNESMEFDEEIKKQLEIIKTDKKFSRKEGNNTITVSKNVAVYHKPGSTIYDEAPTFPTVSYSLEDSEKDQSLSIMIAGTDKPNKYNVMVTFLRKDEFQKDFGTFFSIFLNNSYEEKINFLERSPSADFGIAHKTKNKQTISYNKYYVTGSINKNELKKLKTADSILVVIGSDGDVKKVKNKRYVASSTNLIPDKLFSAALVEFFNYE